MSTLLAGLVLAAGRGSRFACESDEALPKVLRPVLGRPMIEYVTDALTGAGVNNITLIVGYGADDVIGQLGDSFDYVRQDEQLGSGHAVARAKERFRDFTGCAVVMCGDSPLFTTDTVRRMIDRHTSESAWATLTTAVLADPSGYGRIARDASGAITSIVEQKCADEDQLLIREINGGAYAFDSLRLFDNIEDMRVNEAGEYNLTDMVRVFIEQDGKVASVECDPAEVAGVNTVDELRAAEEVLRSRG